MFFMSEEKKIKREIYRKAKAMAEDAYQKEIMFKSLQTSDLHYAIIQDLMKAAQLTGLVTITLKDGSVIKIENKENAREQLNNGGLY